MSAPLDFRGQLSIEQVQMRTTDLCQVIRMRLGTCQEAADAIKAIEAAVAPVYHYVMTADERRQEAARIERQRLSSKQP